MTGQFLIAQKELKFLDQKTFEQAILEIGCDEINICSYAFICFLLRKHEASYYHSLASTLLSAAFCHLEGGYYAAIYHARRAIDLSPNDIQLQENLLFLMRFLVNL